MKKFEHQIDENTTTKHCIDITFTTVDVFVPGISNVMIEFIDWN